MRAVEACGPHILEVGVGTGLSLGYYSPGSEVHGVDLSEDMLQRAREKVARRGLNLTNKRRLLCLSMFWHFLDVIWIGVFTFVYLMGVLP